MKPTGIPDAEEKIAIILHKDSPLIDFFKNCDIPDSTDLRTEVNKIRRQLVRNGGPIPREEIDPAGLYGKDTLVLYIMKNMEIVDGILKDKEKQ